MKRIRMPWPVTVNSMYRSVRNTSILSKRARAYYGLMQKKIDETNHGACVEVPVVVTVLLHPPKRFKYDVDNYFKMVLDCLKGRWFNDDSQIFDLRGVKRQKDPAGKGFVNIIMETL